MAGSSTVLWCIVKTDSEKHYQEGTMGTSTNTYSMCVGARGDFLHSK